MSEARYESTTNRPRNRNAHAPADADDRQRRERKRITLPNRSEPWSWTCPVCGGKMTVADGRDDWIVCRADGCKYNRLMNREDKELRDGRRAQIVRVTVDRAEGDTEDSEDDGNGGDRR